LETGEGPFSNGVAAMLIAGLVFAALAALVHVYIFYIEAVTWTSPGTRAVFGTSEDEAQTTKLMALNQGFYNLFLAVVTAVGIVLILVGHHSESASSAFAGAALVFAGVGSMAAAAVVLWLSATDKKKKGGALKQGVFPVIAIVLLVLGLA